MGLTSGRAPLGHSGLPTPADFCLPPPCLIDTCGPDGCVGRLLYLASQVPDIHPLTEGVRLCLDVSLNEPFRVRHGTSIALQPKYLGNLCATALHLRHALELALWQRVSEDTSTPETVALVSLAAGRAGALYHDLLLARERALCSSFLPKTLRHAFSVLGGEPATLAGDLSIETVPRLAAALLPLQGIRDLLLDDFGWNSVRDKFLSAAEVAAPLDYLLTRGGDGRLVINPQTGLNGYGCSPRPRPWAITFSSSTATSVSDLAFRQAEMVRESLIKAALEEDLDGGFQRETERVRGQLAALYGSDSIAGTEIILTASGTDAELYALFLALEQPGDEVVNVVVAPDETGSGVLRAAGGRHFAPDTPFGGVVEVGAPVDGLPLDRVVLAEVGIRDDDARLLPPDMVDRQTVETVRKAGQRGSRVLLHYVDSSKTGVSAPTLTTILALQKLGYVDVVVDACQMRLDRHCLRRYLELGFLVLVTGSKFFTGPPFSGAVFVPPQIARRLDDGRRLPRGFSAYTSVHEWPGRWRAACSDLSRERNIGLLLRWNAALWEMRAFHAVPPAERYRALVSFGEAIRTAIRQSQNLEPLACAPPERALTCDRGEWDQLQTIFTFKVIKEGLPLTVVQCRRVYRWLNTNITRGLPPDATELEGHLAATRCHVGQPVKVGRIGGEHIGALRLSAGARLVSGAAHDRSLGPQPATRLTREIWDALTVLGKISLIMKYMDRLDEQGIAASGEPEGLSTLQDPQQNASRQKAHALEEIS
ncbi:MAG: hypothetical protein U9Q81_02485 [Pseudomonadota bacterium]|nr:hypothetical protein [Pseudomonadota bacterium]